MHENEIKQTIKNDDFLTFRKLLKQVKPTAAAKAVLVRAVKSHVGAASQETYLAALTGTNKPAHGTKCPSPTTRS